MRYKKFSKTKVVKVTIFMGYFLLVIIYLLPFIWTAITSVKPTPLIFASPPVFKFQPTINHYVRLYTVWDFFSKVWNSLIVSAGTTAICIGVGSIAAFSLARYRIGKDFLPIWILSNRFLPPVAIVLPLFLMFKFANLLDTHIALILTNLIANVPFSIWILRGFFAEIPHELDDAAKVDGCGEFMTLWKVIFPIAKPAIAVTAIFIFLFSWNEFLIPLALSGTKSMLVPVAFAAFRQKARFDWGAMCAAAVICLIPLGLMVMSLQKHIIRGMTLGAVKE